MITKFWREIKPWFFFESLDCFQLSLFTRICIHPASDGKPEHLSLPILDERKVLAYD